MTIFNYMEEKDIEIIAKSMYKAVRKALGTAISERSKDQSREKQNKDVVADVLDDNFSAEAGLKTPPKKTANMNKSKKGVTKLSNFKEKVKKKYEDRATTASGVSEMGIENRRASGDNSLKSGYSKVASPEKHKETAKKIARNNLAETKQISQDTKHKNLGKKEKK